MSRILRLNRGVADAIVAVLGPISDVVFYVNSSCNLRCRHCYVGDKVLGANYRFHTEDVCALIDAFSPLERITILGGEPLLHPGINEIIDCVLLADVRERRLTTNLTDFFYLNCEHFSDAPVTIAVSLDGASAETHDDIRGAGTFAATLSNICRMLKAGFEVEITHTVNKRNLAEFPKLISLCRELGVKKLNLHKVSAHGNAIQNTDLLIGPAEWGQFCDGLEAIHQHHAGGSTIQLRYPVLFVSQEAFVRLIQDGTYHAHREGSFYGVSKGHRIVIYGDGKVYVSSELFGTEGNIGSIIDGDFVRNDSDYSELHLVHSAWDEHLLSKLVPAFAGGEHSYVQLSVSYKNTLLL